MKYEKQSLSSDIKYLRAGKTQKQASIHTGVKQSVISRMESGKSSLNTHNVNDYISKLSEKGQFHNYEVRIAPTSLPIHALIEDDGSFIFLLLAWKLDFMADSFEYRKISKDWKKLVKETRRAAMVCRKLADEDLDKPTIGIFKDRWLDYTQYKRKVLFDYFFKLMRKADTWWM